MPQSVFSLGNGLSSVEAWFCHWRVDIEEVLSGVGGISCMSWSLMSSSLLTPVDQIYSGLRSGAAGFA